MIITPNEMAESTHNLNAWEHGTCMGIAEARLPVLLRASPVDADRCGRWIVFYADRRGRWIVFDNGFTAVHVCICEVCLCVILGELICF